MAAAAGAAVLAGTAGSVMAQDAAGGMSPWQLGFQASASGVMDDIHWFNNMTLGIITVITLFVLALLIIVMVRFNARANPTPSRTSHNTMIEVVWTVAPILILVVIAVPSFRLLYKQLEIPAYDMTIKATGYQWYWGYEYTDESLAGISFDSLMLKDDERAAVAEARGVPLADVPRLLATDYDVVVPVGKTVRVQVTAADVLHAFAMPAFGVKIDAVPGRLNETWFKAEKTGVYYGQCSELCGKDHAFMPITVRVVTQEQFDAWSEAAKSDLDDANKALMASLAAERKVADAALPAQVTAR
ncbi:cytochrome c oxidase subunit II [Pannonibacter carbonis]|uniref:cytochrome c oxidase subunit II n=1 Tax=Pannonibacter carbonis TaxID=2067569 RepID=UPI0018E51537